MQIAAAGDKGALVLVDDIRRIDDLAGGFSVLGVLARNCITHPLAGGFGGGGQRGRCLEP